MQRDINPSLKLDIIQATTEWKHSLLVALATKKKATAARTKLA
jgi:hypothetical protein